MCVYVVCIHGVYVVCVCVCMWCVYVVCVCGVCMSDGGGQMAERLGSRAINQTVVGSSQITLCPWARHFHPTCLKENVPVLTVTRSG